MLVNPTILEGVLIIQPQIFADERGYFVETFNDNEFRKATSYNVSFVQDNESKSNFGVVRGLHFQLGLHAQAKLVRVVKGKVLDVVVDVRRNSPTFLQHIAVELSEENKTQLFIPRGFAHGFSVLEDNTIFCYKCDNFYNKPSEGGIHPLDKSLNIDWKISKEQMLISEKDNALPQLSNEIKLF